MKISPEISFISGAYLSAIGTIVCIAVGWLAVQAITPAPSQAEASRVAENAMWDAGWSCTRQDIELVKVEIDGKAVDGLATNCTRFERDGRSEVRLDQYWHVFSKEGYLPKGARDNQLSTCTAENMLCDLST